jgi:hypothetical protein
MPTVSTPNPLGASRNSASLQRLQLITDLVASDPEDLSTIPQVLTGAHNAHYQISPSRQAVVLLATPPAGFTPDPTRPQLQWPGAARFNRMARQAAPPPPLLRLIAPHLPATWTHATITFAPHTSPYLRGTSSSNPSSLFALHISPPSALQEDLHPNNPYKLAVERYGLEMAVAAALNSTPLLQLPSNTQHPIIQHINATGGVPFVAYAPPVMVEAKMEQSRSVILIIFSQGLSTSEVLNDPLLTHVFLSRTAASCALKACSPAQASETSLQHNAT